ncbi:hypothetical protein BHE74_00048381 [Ensete ventricosum]|nr:hypothetical protein BHE74_00048381 [Ensete ventricosum]
MSLSPLDGRYTQKVKDLRPFFSEYGLIRHRVLVEVSVLVQLACFQKSQKLQRSRSSPASPTTLGKEMANFAVRLSERGKAFSNIHVLGKFAGAVGNYNAHIVAYPDINWKNISAEFVQSLGVDFNAYVTQVYFSLYIIA